VRDLWGSSGGRTEHELAETFQEHAKHKHDMDMDHGMAMKKVKMAQEGDA
jgi:hypothetical protein